jgi:hypothetical protein
MSEKPPRSYYIRDLYAAIRMPDALSLVIPETASYDHIGVVPEAEDEEE